VHQFVVHVVIQSLGHRDAEGIVQRAGDMFDLDGRVRDSLSE
jgi:hypothetical protein